MRRPIIVPSPRLLRRGVRSAVASALLVLLVLSAVPPTGLADVATTQPAATLSSTIDLTGRGYGHGRGMSQYGALGYATTYGWSRDQILGHFYGGTRAATIAGAGGITIDPSAVRVRLTGLDDEPGTLVGTSSSSTLGVVGVGGRLVPATHKAVRALRAGDRWSIDTAPTCDGPWTPLGPSDGDTVTVRRSSGVDDLFTCNPDGSRRHYAGSIRAQITDVGTRTINIVPIEEYLRGVVPNEMPAAWHPAALQAQAVAARSYAMAGDTRHLPYADTCDSTLCQVYDGRYYQPSATAPKVPQFDTRTDAAIAATAGVVRVFAATGRIARTEFHSSSGGWTAGGDFPAVEDRGDEISPMHTWGPISRSVGPLLELGEGNLTAITITERNGLGPEGGRVLEVRLTFDGQTEPVYRSGPEIRAALGLPSDWFLIVGQCATEDHNQFIDAAHRLFLRRAPTDREMAIWCDRLLREPRLALASDLSRSDEWAGLQIDELYRTVLGREPDPVGRAYWLDQIRSGVQVEDVAAGFYASTEFFLAVGATNSAYVAGLYQGILDRLPDPAGQAYWTQQLDAGLRTRRAVAALFYRSLESRRVRVTANYQLVLLRDPDPGGLDHWVERLLVIGEIDLAAHLAASTEYWNRVTAG